MLIDGGRYQTNKSWVPMTIRRATIKLLVPEFDAKLILPMRYAMGSVGAQNLLVYIGQHSSCLWTFGLYQYFFVGLILTVIFCQRVDFRQVFVRHRPPCTHPI